MAPAFLAILLFLAAPVAVGAVLGLLARRVNGARLQGGVWLATIAAVPPIGVGALMFAAWELGIWDSLVVGLGVGAGIAITGHAAFADPRRLLLSGVMIALALCAAESLARRLPKAPNLKAISVEVAPPSLADLVRNLAAVSAVNSLVRDSVCHSLFGRDWPTHTNTAWFVRDRRLSSGTWTLPSGRERSVLAVGDSMLYGLGLPADKTIPADLERLDSRTSYVNVSFPGIGPDAYFLLTRRWAPVVRPAAVVWFLFAANDLTDIGAPYPCCDWGPLLRYTGGRAAPRCTRPEGARHSPRSYLLGSPAPYLARALAGDSFLAARIVIAASRGGDLRLRGLEGLRPLGEILRTTADELRQQGTAFLVVVLPWRASIDGSGAQQPDPVEQGMLRAARSLGIVTLDPATMLREATASGDRSLFLNEGDVHFSTAGSARMAEWLSQVLPTALALAAQRLKEASWSSPQRPGGALHL